MRRLALITFLVLMPLAAAPPRRADATRAAQQCPLVRVTCPDSAHSGEEISFELAIDSAAAAVKYAYNWEVSAGTIPSGQGSPSLRVDTTGVGGGQVTATVEVAGLPASCERTYSCTTGIIHVIGCGLDEYGDISFDDEKARLDNFAIELQNDPTSRGYLLCYGGRVGRAGEAEKRCGRAKDYMADVRGIGRERLITVDGGFREDLTVKIVVVPAGATPPSAAPTVDPREVVIVSDKPGRKPRPR